MSAFRNNLFDDDDIFTNPSWTVTKQQPRQWMPACDVQESDKDITVHASVPGFKKPELSVDVTDNVLTIEGKKESNQEDKMEGYVRREIASQSFKRSFTLPENAKLDDMKAKLEHGILELSIPKVDPEVKSRKIQIH